MRFATMKDRALIESICSHPDVLPWIVHDRSSALNVGSYLQAPHKVVLVDDGVFIAARAAPEQYAVHTCLLPGLRGAKALRSAGAALDMFFSSTDCETLTTMVPVHNRQAAWFARAMGFKYQFTRRAIWPLGGRSVDVEFFKLTIDDWALQGSCIEPGQQFHAKLHAFLSELKVHPDDKVHDAYVGAAVALIRAGQVDKAISFYNRWARFALYAPIALVSRDPLVIDIQSCLIQIHDGDFTVKGKHASRS
jgi:hypothetical protein